MRGNRRLSLGWARRPILAAIAAILVYACFAPVGRTALAEVRAADPVDGVALPDATLQSLPRQLSDADRARYSTIFHLQANAKWRAADREIKQLENKILLGHVLFQRYMHPTAYRSSYKELYFWLKTYADHPGANRVYKLAVRRRPSDWKAPRRPVAPSLGDFNHGRGQHIVASATSEVVTIYDLPRWVRRKLVYYLRRGRPTTAQKFLADRKVKRTMKPAVYDYALARVAEGHFYAGNDDRAYEMAARAAHRSAALVPLSDWVAGLAAWRTGDYQLAEAHFANLAFADSASPWEQSAGGYWAARAGLRGGRPASVSRYLARAAAEPRTFYGILAAQQLAQNPGYSWHPPELDGKTLERLDGVPAIRRALALAEAGQPHLADNEFKAIFSRADHELADAILALASQIGAPATAYYLARAKSQHAGMNYDAALYPLLPAIPGVNYRIDKALVHALIRQESHFNTNAKSRAGARGLMQLMPSTASFIGADRSLRRGARSTLHSPYRNLELGQKYIDHLLGDDVIQGDLVKMIAAYNGGPGNLRKWLRATGYDDDPLLFIEAIPSRETRDYVEKVLTNFWIYRDRFGQPAPSLQAMAAGDWPRYIALDGSEPDKPDRWEHAYAD